MSTKDQSFLPPSQDSNMDNSKLYLLLKVIKDNKNLNLLLREGLSFRSIGLLTENAAENNFVEILDNKLRLTQLGESLYQEMEKKFKRTNKNEWIEEEKKSKIPQISIDFIYLPDQTNLPF